MHHTLPEKSLNLMLGIKSTAAAVDDPQKRLCGCCSASFLCPSFKCLGHKPIPYELRGCSRRWSAGATEAASSSSFLSPSEQSRFSSVNTENFGVCELKEQIISAFCGNSQTRWFLPSQKVDFCLEILTFFSKCVIKTNNLLSFFPRGGSNLLLQSSVLVCGAKPVSLGSRTKRGL